MPLVLNEILDLLKERYDEITLLELLDISSEDLVDRFQDKIEERYDQLQIDLEEIEDEGVE